MSGLSGSSGASGPGGARAHRRAPAEEVTFTLDDSDPVVGARQRPFDVAATLGGAAAALGTLVILASLVGAAVGAIGYQTGVKNRDLSIGGLVGGLVVLLLACLVGGWVAGRMARHRTGLHGLVAPLWLVVLAGGLAVLTAVFGNDLDVSERIDLPGWFARGALTTAAIVTGVVALLVMVLGGWLGGRLARWRQRDNGVSVLERRRSVRTRAGGIVTRGGSGHR